MVCELVNDAVLVLNMCVYLRASAELALMPFHSLSLDFRGFVIDDFNCLASCYKPTERKNL